MGVNVTVAVRVSEDVGEAVAVLLKEEVGDSVGVVRVMLRLGVVVKERVRV